MWSRFCSRTELLLLSLTTLHKQVSNMAFYSLALITLCLCEMEIQLVLATRQALYFKQVRILSKHCSGEYAILLQELIRGTEFEDGRKQGTIDSA